MRTSKEQSLDNKIIETLNTLNLSGKALEAAQMILADAEVQAIQEYANNVSIVRLAYNDHGPVHMRSVTLNAIIMLGFLRQAEVKTSLEKEGVGGFEDSLVAVIFAAMLHDLGMSMGRQDHEIHSCFLASPVMERLLSKLYREDLHKKVMIRSLAFEGISGHMGSRVIHSLEAGVIQVADGCDMTKGRARISMILDPSSRGGNIHQYSANSIKEVRLTQGHEKPIHIEVIMSSEVGLFQVEEVLLHKIASGTAKPYIELFAQVEGEEPKQYL
jgi:metal-dependent HD superfamily phosphatase/phosphodiesterase